MADPALPRDTHQWVLARLTAYAAGVLDEVEEARFQEHIASCGTCGESAAAFEPASFEGAEEPAAGHLPRSLIARWDRASQELRGFERVLVQKHLLHCAGCRADLEFLNFNASLPADAPAQPVRRAKSTPAWRTRPAWLQWALGAWAVTATLVALLFASRQPGLMLVNGIYAGDQVIRLGDSTHVVPAADLISGAQVAALSLVRPASLAPGTTVLVEVGRPAEEPLFRQSGPIESFCQPKVLTLVDPHGLETGTYLLRVVPGNVPPLEFAFELRGAASR